jgi:hypothetical protein
MMKRVVLAVAFAVLVPCLAMAGGVSFTTAGTFSNSTLFPITFTGTSLTSFAGGNVGFGLFTVSACPTGCHGTETFTLVINETSPVSETVDLVGKLSGDISKTGVTSLTLTFSTAEVTIGSNVYRIPFSHSINFGMTTLNGSIHSSATVPEPSAELLLGMGALGLMGLVTVSRKRISV